MGTRYLLLLRHGEYHTNPEHPRRGGLTLRGRRQVAAAAKALARNPVDVIISSTIPRAIESADIVAERLPGIPRRRRKILCELLPGLLHRELQEPRITRGASLDRVMGRLCHDLAYRLSLIERCDHAAERRSMFVRAEEIYLDLLRPTRGRERTEVIVAHGNLIRFLWCRAMGAEPFLWSKLDTNNAGITRIQVRPDGEVAPVTYNDISHLRLALRT